MIGFNVLQQTKQFKVTGSCASPHSGAIKRSVNIKLQLRVRRDGFKSTKQLLFSLKQVKTLWIIVILITFCEPCRRKALNKTICLL